MSNPYLIPMRPRSQQQQQQQNQQKKPEARTLMLDNDFPAESTKPQCPQQSKPAAPATDALFARPVVRYANDAQQAQPRPNRASSTASQEPPQRGRSQPMFASSANAAHAVHRAMMTQPTPMSSSSSHTAIAGMISTNAAHRHVGRLDEAMLHHVIRHEVTQLEAAAEAARQHQLNRHDDEEEQLSSSNDPIAPPASDDAARVLARMREEQRQELAQIQQLEREQQQVREQRDHHHSPAPRPQQQQNQHAATARPIQHALLPSTFVPVPPSRWRFPPQLPARRILSAADGPRMHLLEMLEQLEVEDQQQQQQRFTTNNSNSSRNGGKSIAGSRVRAELWIAVFEFLDPREVCRCAEVSRRWLCIARSEFLWRPILETYFTGLISAEEEEQRFEARIRRIHQEEPRDNNGQQLAAAPPRPSNNNGRDGNDDADDDSQAWIRMPPSLVRISTFVEQHRGRVRGELRAVEARLQQTEQRMQQNAAAAAAAARYTAASSNRNNTANNNDISALERTVTNERNVLLRQLQDLEPKVRDVLERLREAEAAHAQHSRKLNDGIVSAKRSALQLDAVSRKTVVAERRARDRAALEDLERRICVLVLDCTVTTPAATAGQEETKVQLPASLRKSIRNFSQLELLLLSCAQQPALAELPRRWERVKGTLLCLDALESLRREIEECDDPKGVLEGRLKIAAPVQQNNSNINSNQGGSSATTARTTIRFSDCLLGSNRAPRVGATTSGSTALRAQSEPQQQQRSFSSDTQLSKQKLIAEMCTMNDVDLSKFLFA